MLATRATARTAANGLTYGLANKNALTDCAKRKSYTKEIAEIFLCLFPQIADKIQRRGLQ